MSSLALSSEDISHVANHLEQASQESEQVMYRLGGLMDRLMSSNSRYFNRMGFYSDLEAWRSSCHQSNAMLQQISEKLRNIPPECTGDPAFNLRKK
jgi:uncharacterized protein YukE